MKTWALSMRSAPSLIGIPAAGPADEMGGACRASRAKSGHAIKKKILILLQTMVKLFYLRLDSVPFGSGNAITAPAINPTAVNKTSVLRIFIVKENIYSQYSETMDYEIVCRTVTLFIPTESLQEIVKNKI